MDIVVVLLGIAALVFAQRRIARERADTWVTMGVLFAILIPLTLLTGLVDIASGARWFVLGAAAGGLLYIATQLFLTLVRPWRAFTSDVQHLYRQRNALPLAAELPLGALIAAGEELFWRGLLIAVLTPRLGLSGAGLVSLALFVAVNAASVSRPVIAGALVGGAVWTGLALWSPGGLLAAITCHITWTVLMIAFPRRGIEAGPEHSPDLPQPTSTQEPA